MSRHKDQVSLRKPESTSQMRSTGFNKDRVNEFFDNYMLVLEKFKFTAEKIYNLDESGVPTVLKPVNVVSTKGKKQVGQVSSGERGENVTFVGIINAVGNTIPPVYIVGRVRNPEQYIQGAPQSSLVLGNKSAWMTKELFMHVLKHIQAHTNCSTQNPILLLIDNHESHVSVEAVKFCKGSGIVLLSFPPHTTHRMQPLDIGIFGPFKSALATIFDDWLISNPGKTITIRNLGEFTNKAFNRAFTRQNIINSFKKPGIWQVNRLAFSEDDFVASTVTDQPQPQNIFNGSKTDEITEKLAPSDHPTDEIFNSTSHTDTSCQLVQHHQEGTQTRTEALNKIAIDKSEPCSSRETVGRKTLITDVRPYPKAKERKVCKGRKRQSKSKIYTSTPILNELLEYEKERQSW